MSCRYPPAPWHLYGDAVTCLRWRDADAAARRLPPALKVARLGPGHTLGALYVARYGAGSSLEYSELIAASAVSRYAAHAGFWLSALWVDNPQSVAGGREIWNLPKQSARFDWSSKSVRVTANGRVLCMMEWEPRRFGLRLPLLAPVTTVLDSSPRVFSITGSARVSLTHMRAFWMSATDSSILETRGTAMLLRGLRIHIPPMRSPAR